MRVLVSGGGTAGHIYPALTVAGLAAADETCEVAFVGAPGSLEEKLAGDAGIEFLPVRASGWDRARPLTLLTAIGTAIASLARCLLILRSRRTDVVIGFGGYASVPLGLAAALAGVPLVLHEQNSVPGLANRVLSRWARSVCLTYAEGADRLPAGTHAVVTGDPVRESVIVANRDRGRVVYGVADDEVLLLVFGGSRGARHLNAAVVDLYSRLKDVERLRIVQIAGPAELETTVSALRDRAGELPPWWSVLGYVDGMGDLLAAADLLVCRAGATTLAEAAVLGKASVLVPYPYATDDHQTTNTVPFVHAGAAVSFADAGIDEPAFGDVIIELLKSGERRAGMERAASGLGRSAAGAEVLEVACEAARRSPHATRVEGVR